MARKFTVDGVFKPKVSGHYPWPWEGDKERTLELFDDDVLSRVGPDLYNTVTGLCCCNVRIKDSEVEPWGRPVHLVM